jgi:hypothetical protein
MEDPLDPRRQRTGRVGKLLLWIAAALIFLLALTVLVKGEQARSELGKAQSQSQAQRDSDRF